MLYHCQSPKWNHVITKLNVLSPGCLRIQARGLRYTELVSSIQGFSHRNSWQEKFAVYKGDSVVKGQDPASSCVSRKMLDSQSGAAKGQVSTQVVEMLGKRSRPCRKNIRSEWCGRGARWLQNPFNIHLPVAVGIMEDTEGTRWRRYHPRMTLLVSIDLWQLVSLVPLIKGKIKLKLIE